MSILPLLLLLGQAPLKLTVLQPGSFTFDKIELADPTETYLNSVLRHSLDGQEYGYCSLLDRVVLDGTLSHFLCKTEKIDISGIRPGARQGGNHGIAEPVSFTTPQGIKGIVRSQPIGFVIGLIDPRSVGFAIDLDPKTLNAGLETVLKKYGKKSPDRIDVFVNVMVDPADAWESHTTSVTIDTADGYRYAITDGISMIVPGDLVTPNITVRLKIVRRIEDRRLPFHLVPRVSNPRPFPER